MEKRTIGMYGNKVYGETVSGYGLDHGYLDYYTLARIVGDRVLNNIIRSETYLDEWEVVCGEEGYGIDIDGNECDIYSDECVDVVYYDIYQDYIISEYGYKFLAEHTDEIVFYNERLDIYIWGITHFGTSWDYVLTNIKLIEE